MTTRHPNRRRLQRWLDTGETRRVASHIEDCARCQEILETLSALDETMVADLEAATTPPEDLRERTHGGVDVRLRDEAATGAFLDLFTIGWDVIRFVLDPDTTERDGPHDRRLDADEDPGGSE
ncbi:MAG: hypothetical protein R2695_07595 [Acidimicrobiales bacterium]